MPFVIGSACIDVKDGSCVAECPVDCIYEGARKLYINPDECIDCGACVPACPVDAIWADRLVPEAELELAHNNATFFAETLPGRSAPLGMAGGSTTTGPIGVDTPLVSGWPAAERHSSGQEGSSSR